MATMLAFALIGSALLGSDSTSSGERARPPQSIGTDAQHKMADPVVQAAEKVGPTVVSILSSHGEDAQWGRSFGLGSGVIFQKAGNKVRIVTNNHVIEGSTRLEVITATGERKTATLVGSDQISDLAVLEVDGSGIQQIADFGDSDQLKPGETAIAIGNPLGLGYAPTITKGIISWPKRSIPVSLGRGGEPDWEMDVIQTDAAINSGNSGGALVNLEGQVIGINTLKVADYGVEGLGFAIPINQVRTVIDSLIQYHKVKRPYMGVVTQDLRSFAGTDVLKLPSEVKNGIIVLDVTGPAEAAGLKTNDVITELDGKPMESTIDLRKYIYGYKSIGDKLKVTYYRSGKRATAVLQLGELKDK
jgi:serine protease Do